MVEGWRVLAPLRVPRKPVHRPQPEGRWWICGYLRTADVHAQQDWSEFCPGEGCWTKCKASVWRSWRVLGSSQSGQSLAAIHGSPARLTYAMQALCIAFVQEVLKLLSCIARADSRFVPSTAERSSTSVLPSASVVSSQSVTADDSRRRFASASSLCRCFVRASKEPGARSSIMHYSSFLILRTISATHS